ncbi:MFS transporter [Endozoicomonas sp. ONNA2]|uniref:MFS transporter n=1 Tax=Endozoicomonas sp. ONNA2 TaxID=2828741 RepID=UPI00214966A5|nr:MFS transporter [Endozoicomonas sp. ONNA2]
MTAITVTLGGGRAWFYWIIATTFVLFLFNLQTGYNIINPELESSLSLSVAQIGLVASTYTVVFAICQLFSGPLLDRFGIRWITPFAITVVAIGAMLLARAENFEMLLVAEIVMALGSVFGFVGAGFVGGKWFGPAKFGLMFGFVQTASCIGSLFGGNIINECLADFSWREIIETFSYFGFCLAIVVFIFLRDSHPMTGEFSVMSVLSKLVNAARVGQIWIIMLMGAALFGTLLCMAVVWASKIIQSHGVGLSDANTASLLVWLGAGVAAAFMDKFSRMAKSRKKVVIICQVIYILSILALLYLPMDFYVACCIILILGFVSSAQMLTFTMASEVVPVELEGTSAAFVNSGMFIAGTILISLPGYLLPDTRAHELTLGDFQEAMTPIWIINIVVLVIAIVFMKDTYKQG